MRVLLTFTLVLFCYSPLFSQKHFAVLKDLGDGWLKFENGTYEQVQDKISGSSTVYARIETVQFPDGHLLVESEKPFNLFFNSKLSGEYRNRVLLNLDSLSRELASTTIVLAIFQPRINERDLKARIVSVNIREARRWPQYEGKPATYFRDFVVTAGLIVIIVGLVITRLNPKLASDYFSVTRIFSLREGEDSQSGARLTSSTNVQFYIWCSLLLGFYMLIILHHLPEAYVLPGLFPVKSFWSAVWQWLKLGTFILGILFLKLLLIFALTRLFSMTGVARIHFFNWIRILLLVFGTATIIVFIYYISRGQQPGFFVGFLILLAVVLTAWVVLAFLKLTGKSEHSLFHLFSYICATEIIPLLITVKVLFQ